MVKNSSRKRALSEADTTVHSATGGATGVDDGATGDDGADGGAVLEPDTLDVRRAIHAPKLLGVVGCSGSGKTTLAAHLARTLHETLRFDAVIAITRTADPSYLRGVLPEDCVLRVHDAGVGAVALLARLTELQTHSRSLHPPAAPHVCVILDECDLPKPNSSFYTNYAFLNLTCVITTRSPSSILQRLDYVFVAPVLTPRLHESVYKLFLPPFDSTDSYMEFVHACVARNTFIVLNVAAIEHGRPAMHTITVYPTASVAPILVASDGADVGACVGADAVVEASSTSSPSLLAYTARGRHLVMNLRAMCAK